MKRERRDSVIEVSDDEASDKERERASDSTLQSSNKENHIPATMKKVFNLVKTIPLVMSPSTPQKDSTTSSLGASPRPASPDLFGPEEDDGMPIPPDITDIYDSDPTPPSMANEAILDEVRCAPAPDVIDEELTLTSQRAGRDLRNVTRTSLDPGDDIPCARNKHPRPGPWIPPLECTDDAKAPWDTDYEGSDGPAIPAKIADTSLRPLARAKARESSLSRSRRDCSRMRTSSSAPASATPPQTSDVYGAVIRTVVQLMVNVSALPADARAKLAEIIGSFDNHPSALIQLLTLASAKSCAFGTEELEGIHSEGHTQNWYVPLIRARYTFLTLTLYAQRTRGARSESGHRVQGERRAARAH